MDEAGNYQKLWHPVTLLRTYTVIKNGGKIPPMQLINHNSLILLAAGIFAVAVYVLLRDGVKKRDLLALGGLLVVMLAAWLAIRPQATPLADAEAVQARIGMGVPVLLELQSPY
jgi:hypothetical protein